MSKPNEPTHAKPNDPVPAKPATPVVVPVTTNPLLRSQAAVNDAAAVGAKEEKEAKDRAAAQKSAAIAKDPVAEQKTAIDRAFQVRDEADKAILEGPERRAARREKEFGQGTDEEKRSGQAIQPPTPKQNIQSHEPGQANGPNQLEQERTDKGIFLDPNESDKPAKAEHKPEADKKPSKS